MVDESKGADVAKAMRQINQAWVNGQIQDLAPMVHPEIVMVFPGFAGRVQGRETLLAGFADFCQNATIHEFREYGHQVDVVGDTAVVIFEYGHGLYRSGARYRSTGRDLWVFQLQDTA